MSTQINEGLQFKDMVGLIKPTLFVDEFISKMGEDDAIVVLSFYVRMDQIANDLVDWFEKGYDFVLDADRSPGEVKPNRYLVYVEMERRTKVIDNIEEMLGDLETLTEHEIADWVITYEGQESGFDHDALMDMLILSPHHYRIAKEKGLNEMRTLAQLPVKSIVNKKDKELQAIQIQAGII